MRIISGKFGSRPIQAVEGIQTRPTTDKVKEAIFSRIGPYFEGGKMLDLYAGSGAMSLEAISRGMSHSVMVDKDIKAIRTIDMNIKSLDVKNQCTVLKMDAFAVLRNLASQKEQFDLVFLDPPYAQQRIEEILTFLCVNDMLQGSANVIAETAKEDALPEQIDALVKVKEAIYGMSKITYYKRRIEHD